MDKIKRFVHVYNLTYNFINYGLQRTVGINIISSVKFQNYLCTTEPFIDHRT